MWEAWGRCNLLVNAGSSRTLIQRSEGERGTHPAVSAEQIDQFGPQSLNSSNTTLGKVGLVTNLLTSGRVDFCSQKNDLSAVPRIIMPFNFLALEDIWACLNEVLFCI